jgi:four helix bundle protein
MGKLVRNHKELDVYQRAFSAAMGIFELSKQFPREETYSLTDQIRRSSRSVCSNLAEAWRKRQYEAMFVSKLTDAEMEAAETQVWLDFAVECNYLNAQKAAELHTIYNGILGSLANMRNNAPSWLLPQAKRR